MAAARVCASTFTLRSRDLAPRSRGGAKGCTGAGTRSRAGGHLAVFNSAIDPEPFVWKGNGAGESIQYDLWEEPGLYVEAVPGSGIEWFFVDVGDKNSKEPPIILLHGMPAYSYLWRNVLPKLTESGRRAIAIDLPGFGLSTCPQVGFGFKFTYAEYVQGIAGVLKDLELENTPVQVVGQGYLGGTVAASYAANFPALVQQLVLMSVPLSKDTSGEVPGALQQLLNPFLSPLFCQNPLACIGKPIEGAGPYALDANDQACYQQPALLDGDVGFAMIEIAKQIKRNGQQVTQDAINKIVSSEIDTVIAYGANDNWLPETEFIKLKNAKMLTVSGVGHFMPEDWAEKSASIILGDFDQLD